MLVLQLHEDGPELRATIDLTQIPPEAHAAGVLTFELSVRTFRFNTDNGVRSCRINLRAPLCIQFQRDPEGEKRFLRMARQAHAARRLAALLSTQPTDNTPPAVAAGTHQHGPLTGQKESA